MNTIKLNTIGILSGGGNAGGGGNSGGGGGTTIVSPKDVNFRDYDGTVLYAYTKDEFLALNELPPLPTQPGLICQEWNWDYADAIEHVSEYGILEIGATYITDDGKTRFYIKVEGERKTLPISFSIDKENSLIIDWGDGVVQSMSGSGSLNVSHTYDSVGDYVISFDIADGTTLSLGGNTDSFCVISSQCRTMLRKVELGIRTNLLGYAFNNCYALSSVTIPNCVTKIGASGFSGCYALSSVTIPNCVTTLSSSKIFAYTYTSVMIPKSVSFLGDESFAECRWLSVVLTDSIVAIRARTFQYCYALTSLKIPKSVEAISAQAFYACTSLNYLDFRHHSSVPTIPTGVMSAAASDYKIVVPDALYDTWIAATNWSALASHIVKASEFNG